jgi:murein DD-endopeptidase MepM/ murein hydrolase activator NlpD
MSRQEIRSLLRGFTVPIQGAHVPDWLYLVPGAPREYRNGIHEGVDFSNKAVGVPIRIGTPIVAAQKGVVIRADWEYHEVGLAEMEEMLATARRQGSTPPGVLDRLRGRQIWIDHGRGVVTRYAHLSAIAPGIEPGVVVKRGQLIGFVGNSGTPEAAEGTGLGPHLHFEIRIGDGYLGEGLNPTEAHQLLVEVLEGDTGGG